MPVTIRQKDVSSKISRRDETISVLIYLTGCAVNETVPDHGRLAVLTSEDLRSLHDLSLSLSLNSIVYTALENTPGLKLPDTDLFQTWKEERDHEVYKSIMFERAWEKLRLFLEERGCWYLLLKGLPMNKFYPEQGMRQMADVDVLFDASHEEEIRRYFEARGFKTESYQQGNADSYLKPPFYNFELHRMLFTYPQEKSWCEYYKDIKNRLIPDEGSAFGFHFTDEDFYIYLIAHASKHFHTNGTGLRSLLDCFLYLKAKGESLDRDYIHKELEKLSVDDFERSCRLLGEKLFSDPEEFSLDGLTEEELRFLDEFLRFGTYGTISNRVRNKLREIEPDETEPSLKTRARYLWGRIFPDMEVFREYYPFFYKHKWLMPVGYLYRLIYKGITNGGQVKDELDALRTKKDPEA